MERIYLDNAATTPVAPEVLEVMMPVFREQYGNPSSVHAEGRLARRVLDKARAQVAAALGAQPAEVYFTAGGTEADNWAITGVMASAKGKHLITSAVEHPSVADTVASLEEQGYTVRRISPRADGTFAAEDFIDAVDGDTVLVTFMMVNNEMGTILPYDKIIPAVRRKYPNVLIHMDGVQGFTKLPLNVKRLDLDLFSFSGHKLYAPKGIGGLYIKKGIRINPVEYGGGQERGIRSGTQSVPLIAAMGEALALCKKDGAAILKNYRERNAQLRALLAEMPQAVINSPEKGCPHLLNISVPGIPSEIMLHSLEEREIYVSSGSACAKGAISSTLEAYGLPPERVRSALRISFSKDTTAEEISLFAEALKDTIDRLSRVIGK